MFPPCLKLVCEVSNWRSSSVFFLFAIVILALAVHGATIYKIIRLKRVAPTVSALIRQRYKGGDV